MSEKPGLLLAVRTKPNSDKRLLLLQFPVDIPPPLPLFLHTKICLLLLYVVMSDPRWHAAVGVCPHGGGIHGSNRSTIV